MRARAGCVAGETGCAARAALLLSWPVPATSIGRRRFAHLLHSHAPSFERLKEYAIEYAFLLKVSGQLREAPLPGSGPAAPAAAAGAGAE